MAYDLPIDANRNPVQVLSPDAASVVNQAIGAVSANAALPTGSRIIRLATDTAFYYLLSTDAASTVSSTTGVFSPGTGVETIDVKTNTRIAVIQSSTSGTLNMVAMI